MTIDTAHRAERCLSRWRIAGWGLGAGLLLLPALAMLFTQEVNWTPTDFVLAALLIGGVGGLVELIVWRVRNPALRAMILTAVVLFAALIWAEGAVGLLH